MPGAGEAATTATDPGPFRITSESERMVQYFNNPRDRSRRALLAVAPWTPADLGSALKWWMDPSAGIYTDAGSTPATADGDLIYRWVCQASGMIFDQSTSGARPTPGPLCQ